MDPEFDMHYARPSSSRRTECCLRRRGVAPIPFASDAPTDSSQQDICWRVSSTVPRSKAWAISAMPAALKWVPSECKPVSCTADECDMIGYVRMCILAWSPPSSRWSGTEGSAHRSRPNMSHLLGCWAACLVLAGNFYLRPCLSVLRGKPTPS